MQVLENVDGYIAQAAETVNVAALVDEKGIEFEVNSLPYRIHGSPLAEFRSGVLHIKDGSVKFDGRDTVPDYLRAKLYTLGSILFLPGLALTYFLIEQVSWIPTAFSVTGEKFIAYTFKDDYSVISILYNPSGSDNSTARRTLTFQLQGSQYSRVKDSLTQNFPGKYSKVPLQPASAAGSSTAAIGVLIWIAFIVGTIIWRPSHL